ncbi:hypothetical protein [Lentzea sokolovensis]|uniref:hypothetical protein n=1 Tax=Lentzea sokolovensis TaxID=3095429 RepID=UPI0029F55E5E|nr:hypothetical protein [Lentzea sp. BCCO 10_0061]
MTVRSSEQFVRVVVRGEDLGQLQAGNLLRQRVGDFFGVAGLFSAGATRTSAEPVGLLVDGGQDGGAQESVIVSTP